jgi:hypothetical protein
LLGVIVAVPTAVMIKEALEIVRSVAQDDEPPSLFSEETSTTESPEAVENETRGSQIVKSH